MALATALVTTLAEGKPIVIETPPVTAASACSFRRPICVHAASSGALLPVLAALESAWESGLVLGVPLPPSYDAYVSPEPSRTAIAARDLLSRRDRGRAFSVIDSELSLTCARDFDAARELYAASALTRTPAIDAGSLRAQTTALAQLAVPCASIDTSVFQGHPDRALVDRHVAPTYDEGSSVFFLWLDASFGKEPGHFTTATWAFGETKTNGDAEWNDEPDVFDVMRESLKDALRTGSTMEDALEEFAVVRALAIPPPPRASWDVAWPSTARTLASPEGIGETGAAYVRVDAKGHKPAARLRVDATWEEHAKLRWVVVKLDAQDHEIARYQATSAPKATEAHVQVADVDDASAFLVVATNVGNWTTPFDPADDVWEPHGWLLTIASE